MKKILIQKSKNLFYLHLPYAATSQVADDLKDLEGVSWVEHSNRYYNMVHVGHAFDMDDVIENVVAHTAQSLINHKFITEDRDTWITAIVVEPPKDGAEKSRTDGALERTLYGIVYHICLVKFIDTVAFNIPVVIDHISLFSLNSKKS